MSKADTVAPMVRSGPLATKRASKECSDRLCSTDGGILNIAKERHLVAFSPFSSNQRLLGRLRRCKILAARLGSAEFGEWVERELNGYPTVEELPNYRILTVRSLGHFAGPFGSGLRNAPIPRSTIPKEYRDWVDVSNLMQPIGAYEDLLSGKSASFQAPWPADLIALVGQHIYERMNCLGAWQELPRGAIVALLDTVRNKVLSFALDIERLSPDAGEAAPGAPTVAAERVQQVFQTAEAAEDAGARQS